ncbi:MAG: hypothetical protein E5X82_17505 [Mesorhizobium sp.]|nr:hypothetical protein [Mesorhizobium ciceri]TJV58829.1 MAG: hypothetical protein E5X82_17505 [Mesorhizobium sp.]
MAQMALMSALWNLNVKTHTRPKADTTSVVAVLEFNGFAGKRIHSGPHARFGKTVADSLAAAV